MCQTLDAGDTYSMKFQYVVPLRRPLLTFSERFVSRGSVRSDGVDTSAADNFNDIYYSLKYEADLLFTRFDSSLVCIVTWIFVPSSPSSLHILYFHVLLKRDSDPPRYDIKSDLSLEEPGVIGPPFNLTFQVESNHYQF